MKIIGHRGARGIAPENTLAALKKALEHGVDEVEIDVRVTSDSQAALVHNSALVDRAGNSLEVASHTFDELKQHKPDLATLEEAISFVNKRVPIIIEVKPKVAAEPIIKTIKKFLATGWQPEDLSLASFDHKLLKKLHRALPEAPVIVNESWSGVRATWRARQLGTRRINIRSWWLWRGFLAPMHRSGWQLAPYTVNDVEQAKRWQKYLYGIITDYPDQFEK